MFAQINEALNAAKDPALQNFGALFIALLVIGMFAIGIVFKYFTGRCDRLELKCDSKDLIIQKLYEDHTKLLADVIIKNTEVFNNVLDYLRGDVLKPQRPTDHDENYPLRSRP